MKWWATKKHCRWSTMLPPSRPTRVGNIHITEGCFDKWNLMYTELVSTSKYSGFSNFFGRNPSNLARGYSYLKKVQPKVLNWSFSNSASTGATHFKHCPSFITQLAQFTVTTALTRCHCCVALLEVVAASSMLRHPDSVKEGLIPNDLLVLR